MKMIISSIKYPDRYWKDAYAHAHTLTPPSKKMVVPDNFGQENMVSYYGCIEDIDDIHTIVVHKGRINSLNHLILENLLRFRVAYENKVFLVLERKEMDKSMAHLEILVMNLIKAAPKTIFMHIPKTAGTSVNNSLKRESAGYIYFGKRNDFLKSKDFKNYNIISGHLFLTDILKKIRKIDIFNFFVILRDPADRFLSAVGHARRVDAKTKLGESMKLMRNLPLQEYVQTSHFKHEAYMQSRMLGISPDINQNDLTKIRENAFKQASHAGLNAFMQKNLGELHTWLKYIYPNMPEFKSLNVTKSRSKYFSREEIEYIGSTEFQNIFAEERSFIENFYEKFRPCHLPGVQ